MAWVECDRWPGGRNGKLRALTDQRILHRAVYVELFEELSARLKAAI